MEHFQTPVLYWMNVSLRQGSWSGRQSWLPTGRVMNGNDLILGALRRNGLRYLAALPVERRYECLNLPISNLQQWPHPIIQQGAASHLARETVYKRHVGIEFIVDFSVFPQIFIKRNCVLYKKGGAYNPVCGQDVTRPLFG